MSISQLYPEEGPSLNLNFAGSRTLDPRITFTRTQTTSNGSTYMGRDGLIKYAGPNEPRFDHRYVNGEIESLGLLVEEQSTNLLPYSVVSTLTWSSINSSIVTNNATTAPDGTNTAARIQVNTSGFVAVLNISVTAGQPCTLSFWVKSVSGSSGTWGINIFDHGSGGFHNRTTRNITGEWTRITYTYTPVGNLINIYVSDDRSLLGTILDGYVWGAQLEQKSFVTSLIPTEGSTKTRNPDNASITGSNFIEWYNQTGYTIFTRHIAPPVTQSGPYPRVFNITTTASGDANRLNHYHTPLVVGSYRVGMSVIENNAITQVDLNTTLSQGLVAKMASRFAENNSALSLNGTIIGTDTNCSINSVTRDILTIGSNINGSYLNSTISQLIYYPYPVSNSQLIALTR